MKQHGHKHDHHHDHSAESFKKLSRKKLILSLALTIVVMGVEVVGGILSKSIALISDAGHMFTHVFALVIALVASIAASKPPCHHRTFGLIRAEILAAFVNSIFLLLVALYIVYESIERFFRPEEIISTHMFVVAILGLLANLGSIWILRGSDKEDINIRGVVLHMLADAASSVAIVIGAIIIFYTGWVFVDPVISIGISILILVWGWNLFVDSARILLQEAPAGLNSEVVAKEIMGTFKEVQKVESGRLWCLTPYQCVYTAHLTLAADASWDKSFIDRISKHLKDRFHIVETTLQVNKKTK